MAEEDNVEIEPVTEEEEPTNYKPPPEKTLQEMIETDQDDESLRKYKEKLLGSSASGAIVVGKFFHGNTILNFHIKTQKLPVSILVISCMQIFLELQHTQLETNHT